MLKPTPDLFRKFRSDERGISSLEVRVVFAVIVVAVIWSAFSLGAL